MGVHSCKSRQIQSCHSTENWSCKSGITLALNSRLVFVLAKLAQQINMYAVNPMIKVANLNLTRATCYTILLYVVFISN